MQEDNSMFDKILGDLERIINNDSRLKSFCIVPVTENKNKTPILYEQHNGVEHHLGLESWCVKHIYKYAYTELFKVRRLLKKNRLPIYKMEELNKFLIGTLIINPEVTTCWNMKRELVEQEVLSLEKELAFAKLILSHKCKSSETFTYRRWLLRRLLQILKPEDRFEILPSEYAVTELAAEKAENNYHAWTHRIWCLESVMSNEKTLDYDIMNSVISEQLDFSMEWIDKHTSQHSGYYYRQFLINCVKRSHCRDSSAYYSKYFEFLKCYLKLSPEDVSNEFNLINKLLGDRDNFLAGGDSHKSESQNCLNYVCVLLYELFYTIKNFFYFYAKHETVWYHRRFVIYHLLQWIYNSYGIDWKPNVKITNSFSGSANIVDACGNHSLDSCNFKFTDNGEKFAKLFKYETDKLESSLLYLALVQSESEIVKKSISGDCPLVRRLAERYEKWLKNVICLKNL